MPPEVLSGFSFESFRAGKDAQVYGGTGVPAMLGGSMPSAEVIEVTIQPEVLEVLKRVTKADDAHHAAAYPIWMAFQMMQAMTERPGVTFGILTSRGFEPFIERVD